MAIAFSRKGSASGFAMAAAAVVALSACATTAGMAERVEIEEETEAYDFQFAYPAAAAAIPALKASLDAEAATILANLEKEAAQAKADGFGGQYTWSMEYETSADIPRFLSLSGAEATYLGGAHGNYGMTSLVWDREAGKGFSGLNLFELGALERSDTRKKYCEGLNAERRKRRGFDVGPEDLFGDCPNFDMLATIVGSTNGSTFDTVTFHAAPYVAGGFAEGAYDVTLPVTPDMIAAVFPEYRASFSLAPLTPSRN